MRTNNTSITQAARTICHVFLSNYSKVTDETIREVIEKIKPMDIVPGQTIDEEELFEILQADFSIQQNNVTIMSDHVLPWLNEERANIKFELWHRYQRYMQLKNPAFPIKALDSSTDQILDKCANPKQKGSWDRRGMVVGHVQSGKTSNYVGLINKATDAGYKLIIVIAGTISSLRRQTQERIDEGYIGRSSSAFINNIRDNKAIGVGNTPVKTEIYSLTSYYKAKQDGDFNQDIANRLNIPIGKNPVVLVIKKNKSILENLIDWLSKDINTQLVDGFPKLFNVPALVIDDEADSASVNASKSLDEIKTINRLIRTLLNLFDQSTFIGYTATPYANLFIPQEHNESLPTKVKGNEYLIGKDLFPRDFIVNIKAPTNYIGASSIFGMTLDDGTEIEPLNIFRPINDFDPPFFKKINKDNKFNLPEYLPNSLNKAILSFILTCATRRLRGHENKHNSMLVHVALLVKWIDRVAYLVNDQLRKYRNAIESNDPEVFSKLQNIFETDFIPTTKDIKGKLPYTDIRIKEHSWEEVKVHIKKAVSKIEVRAVHGNRKTAELEYDNIKEIDYNFYPDGFSVIAVGGTKLSRGITLEGLSISYYLRTTKMYDSLMQMGRWFGYRPGFVDLCRLYTTEQIFSWFNHIALATEEMRNDFDEMTILNQKPKDYRLKVRNHHGLLTITSVAKLYFAHNINISFSGTNPQTYQLLKNKNAIQNNFNSLERLISRIGFPEEKNKITTNKGDIRYLYYPNTNIEHICEFIDNYRIEQPSIKNATLSDYIKKQNEKNTIKEWSICIVSNTDKKVFINRHEDNPDDSQTKRDDLKTYELSYNNETIILGCSVRNQPKDQLHGEFYTIPKNQIDDLKDRQVDLEVKDNKTNSDIKKQRKKEGKGLILIYALDERGTREVEYGIPIIGFSIHFPTIESETKISYTSTIIDDFDDIMNEDDDIIE